MSSKYNPALKFVYTEGNLSAHTVFNTETGLSLYSHQTMEQIKEEFPHAQFLTHEEVNEKIKSAARTSTSRITEEEFERALGELPPMNWIHHKETESFASSEFYVSSITQIYVRIGEEFFTFKDDFDMTHSDCIKKIKNWLSWEVK